MSRLAQAASLLLLLTLPAGVAWAVRVWPYRAPAAALAAFQRFEASAEEQLIDPLVLAGKGVVPLVIDGLRRRSLVGDCWAAAFLGNGGHVEGAPVLAELVGDPAVHLLTRANALRALALLDLPRARALSAGLSGPGSDWPGQAAGDVLAGDHSLTYRRSYVEALLGSKR